MGSRSIGGLMAVVLLAPAGARAQSESRSGGNRESFGSRASTAVPFADPAFIPHGGLLHAEYRPKKAYERLAWLLAEWSKVP